MIKHNYFYTAASRGDIFESGIGNALARMFSGSYTPTPWTPEYGQPSGDGVLCVNGKTLLCEIKSETYPSLNFCFETNGGGGRDSGLTTASYSVEVLLQYHARQDILIAAKPAVLLNFIRQHGGESGIWFAPQMGDGGRAAGFIVPLGLLTGQSWVRTFINFSGQNWTGCYALPPLP
jgi:hypothetical protein